MNLNFDKNKKTFKENVESFVDNAIIECKISADISKIVSEGSIIGVDNSAEMIKLAKDRHSQAIYPNLSFVTLIPLFFVISFNVIVFKISNRENYNEYENSLKNISNIDNL